MEDTKGAGSSPSEIGTRDVGGSNVENASTKDVSGFGHINSIPGSTKDQLAKIIIAWVEENMANLSQAEQEEFVPCLPSFIRIVAAMKPETDITRVLGRWPDQCPR